MNFDLMYDYSTLFILISLLLIFYVKPRWEAKYTKFFIITIIFVISSVSFEVISVLIFRNFGSDFVIVFKIFKALNALFLCFSYMSLFSYIIKKHHSKNSILILERSLIPGLVYISIILLLFFSSKNFAFYGLHFDDFKNLQHQFYALEGVYLVVMCYILYIEKGQKNKSEFVLFMFYFATELSAIILYINYPYVLIINFPLSIFLLILYLLVFNSEKYIDEVTSTFTGEAYLQAIKIAFIDSTSKKNIYVFDISEDLKKINYFGTANLNYVKKSFAKLIKRTLSEKVYMFENDRFVVLSNKDLLKTITRSFVLNPCFIKTKPSLKYKITPLIGYFSIPNDFKNITETTYAINDTFYLNHNSINTVVKIENEILYQKFKDLELESLVSTVNIYKNKSLRFKPVFDVSKNKVTGLRICGLYRNKDGTIIDIPNIMRIALNTGTSEMLEANFVRSVANFIETTSLEVYDISTIFVYLDLDSFWIKDRAKQIINLFREETNKDISILNIMLSESKNKGSTTILMENMVTFQKSGIKLFLNNYGSKESNLNYIVNYPFEGVKLNPKMIHESLINFSMRETINYILRICKDNNLSVILNGVDDESYLKLFDSIKGTFLVGKLYGDYASKDEILDSLINLKPEKNKL